jgi:tetratricopeptide (TPR) repeat protein
LRDHPSRPRPLSPSAETCFQNCLKFAPNLLEGHRALVELYQERKQATKAEKAARQLLERFPDHAATVEELGDLCMEQEKYTEGLEAFERAQRLNPLAVHLRAKRSNAHLFRARTFAEAGQFDEARADYQASINLGDPRQQASPLCKWSACELKAGNSERAEELLARARAEVGSQAAIAFNMVIEAIRLKLPRPLKSRFDKELNDALKEPPTGVAAALVAQTAASHQLAGVKYHGQKTHEKKVLAYVAKAHHADFTESQLESLCHSLLALRSLKELRVFTRLGQRRFPNNPMFPYLEAESYILLGPQKCRAYEVQPLLEKARKLIEKLPRDGKLDALRETIQERERMIGGLSPFMDMFENFFGGMRDDEEEDDDEDEAWGW